MLEKYSLVHLTNAACPPPQMVYAAAKAGYDCVSFRGIPTRKSVAKSGDAVRESITGKMPFDFAGNPALIRDTRKAAKDTGIILNDIENARIFDGGDVSLYEADLEAAAELGIHHILTNIWTDNVSFYTDEYQKLCELAAQYDLTVNIEFVTWAGVKNLQEAVDLIRRTHCQNAGIVLDTLHFYRSHVRVEELAALPKNWFRYLHLCDCPSEIPENKEELIHTGLQERLIPGEGVVPFRDIVKLVPNAVRGIEVPNPARMNAIGFEAYIKLALEKTQEYFKRAKV